MFDLRIFSVFIIMAIAGVGVIWKYGATSNARSPDEIWYFGPPNARWVITEYADLECPYCRAYTPQLKQWVGQQGDVKLLWHHFPLDSHGTAALTEARLVQCAGYLGGAAGFWQAIDQVLLNTRGNGQGLAEELHLLDVPAKFLSNCTKTNMDVAFAVDRQRTEAKRRGIAATPTLEVTDSLTGHTVRLEGPVDSAVLLSVIDALAAQAPLRKEDSKP